MVQVVSRTQAAQRRFHLVLPNGTHTWVDSYIGMTFSEARAKGIELEPGDRPEATPVGYLVRQAPNSEVPGHFHQADEFQIFVDSSGRFGTHEIRPCLHYAGGFTPYPPIVSAGTELRYFTMRVAPDPGAMAMPEKKEMLKAAKRPYRHHLVELDLRAPRLAEGPRMRSLVPPERDGLAAWLVDVPRGTLFSGPSPRAGRGQFVLVLAGDCRIDDEPASVHDMAFVAASDPAVWLEGGDEDALVAIMQFARFPPEAG